MPKVILGNPGVEVQIQATSSHNLRTCFERSPRKAKNFPSEFVSECLDTKIGKVFIQRPWLKLNDDLSRWAWLSIRALFSILRNSRLMMVQEYALPYFLKAVPYAVGGATTQKVNSWHPN